MKILTFLKRMSKETILFFAQDYGVPVALIIVIVIGLSQLHLGIMGNSALRAIDEAPGWHPISPPPGYRAEYKCWQYDASDIVCFGN